VARVGGDDIALDGQLEDAAQLTALAVLIIFG
jgi:hypothetical protein